MALTPFPIIDAHLHVWDAHAHYYPWLSDRPVPFRYGDYSSLPRRYSVADYRRDAAAWQVEGGVYIDAEWDPRDPGGEMDFIAGVRAAEGFPTVAIAQAWLDREDIIPLLESHAARSFVRGVRHKPKPGQMDDARWRSGFGRLAPLGLHFELQAPFAQMGEAARLAGDFPGTTIVVNHAGLPPVSDLSAWRAAMAEVAACPNVGVKVSGLGNLGPAGRREVTLELVELFGARRAMFASNYPVDSLRDTFDAIWRTFDDITRGFSDSERRALFHDN
ncbi:MAG TPA: amidohydrolase family protein, partial [Usitatibacter sp.]